MASLNYRIMIALKERDIIAMVEAHGTKNVD